MRFFNLSVALLFALIWLGVTVFLRIKKNKSYVFLLFFSIFYIYLYKVLDLTLFQYQSLLLLKYLMPGLRLNGQTAGRAMNLVPLTTLTTADLNTSLLNILLMMPFGFGLPFITRLCMKKVIIIGAIFSITIEFLQLTSGQLAGITFRVADINDVIFNTVGAAIGYILFLGFMRLFDYLFRNKRPLTNPVLRYIANLQRMDEPGSA